MTDRASTTERTFLCAKLLAALTAPAIGCSNPGAASQQSQHEKARLSVQMVDAPADVSHVFINPTAIRARRCDSEGNGWDELPVDVGEIDLLSLTGANASALLDEVELTAGRYCEMRIQAKQQPTLVLDDGADQELRIPSIQSSGIKIKGEFSIEPGFITVLTLDFDLDKSLHRLGNGGYSMDPVIEVIDHVLVPENASYTTVFPASSSSIETDSFQLFVPQGAVEAPTTIWCADDPENPYGVTCGPDGTHFDTPVNISIAHDLPMDAGETAPTIFHDGIPVPTVMGEEWLVASVDHFSNFYIAATSWLPLPIGRIKYPQTSIIQGDSDLYLFWKTPLTSHVICASNVSGNVSLSGKWYYPWADPQFESARDYGEDCIRFPVTQEGYYWVQVEGVENSEYNFNLFTTPIPEPNDLWYPCMDCGYPGPYDREWFGDGKNHLAKDYPANVGDTVRAIADGQVHTIEASYGGFGGDDPLRNGPFLVIEHEKWNGDRFFALYGHVNTWLAEGDMVGGGQGIGYVNSYIVGSAEEDWSHLHFGTWDSPSNFPTDDLGYGTVRSFVDPEPFLEDTKYLTWLEP